MLKARVLTASPEGKTEPGTTYSLNYGFKNKKLKVNLNIAIKSEQKQEAEATHKTIEEDRKMLMQVRIYTHNHCFNIYRAMLTLFTVGHRPHHEVSQDHEARPACVRDDPTDQIPLLAEGQRYQEVHRHPPREGIPGASGR